MLTPAELDKYLAEIRSQVCANCVERAPGGPPCAPLGKMCGVELHLPELIDAIHDVHSGSIAPYLEATHQQICDHCSFKRSQFCPCPMDYLMVLIAEAVEAVDARLDRRSTSRQRLASVAGSSISSVEELRQIYDEAAGAWTGCDWPTTFGKSALDLNGWTAAEARQRAAACKDSGQKADWLAAAAWLASVEQNAERAEENAAWAVRAAAEGAWPEAADFARRAYTHEYATGRIIWRGFPMTWQRLFLAVEEAVLLHPNAAQPDQATSHSNTTPADQCQVSR